MFQELAPQDPHEKCGHHYAICLDLKNQRFEVLDAVRSEAYEDLTTHAEYFINNLKAYEDLSIITRLWVGSASLVF